MRRLQGFTVVELMVTVAIISILSAVAFRPFMAFYSSQKIKYAAIEVAGYLRMARAIALKDGGVCEISVSGNTLSSSSLSGNKCTASNLPILNPSSVAGIAGLTMTSDSTSIAFVRHGFMAGSSNTIRLKSTSTGTEWCINTLSPSALVRIGHAEGSASCNYVTG